MHSTDFRALPGVPNCCPLFTSGRGHGISFALIYDFPFYKNSATTILGGARLGYIDHSAILSTTENTNLIINGVSQSGTFTHTVDAALGSLGIEPHLGFQFGNGIAATAGIRAGYLLSKKYLQREVTSAGTFLDSNGIDTKSSIRNERSGDIPNGSSFLLHALFSIGYELPLNSGQTNFLVPELSYAFGLNNVVTGLSWKASTLSFGITFKFSPKPVLPKKVVYDTTISRDTILQFVESPVTPSVFISATRIDHSVVETDIITQLTAIHHTYLHEVTDPHMLNASVQAVGLDDEGNEMPMATLEIEEFLQYHAHPLLGYIFFDKNESNLPSKYVQITKPQSAAYNLNYLFGLDDIEVHHNVLNIIGKRLQEHPQAKITLIGCNNDVGDEKDNLNLSRSRVETVKNYLIRVWSIDPSRVRNEVRGLPEIPSTSRTEDGQAENSRVEIISDDPEITDVFIANDTTRIATPPLVRFKLNATSTSPLVKYSVNIYQNNILLFSAINNEYPGPLPEHWDWDLTIHQSHKPRFDIPLVIKFIIENSLGDKKEVQTSLPTHIRTIAQKKLEHASDVTIDRYNLVLFNFAKSDITPAHERILSVVKSRLKPSSEISIEGYTDRSGTPASNKKLATSRAKSTSDALGRNDAVIRGIGASRLLYPNETPEGRFYCRTVQIVVKTPVE